LTTLSPTTEATPTATPDDLLWVETWDDPTTPAPTSRDDAPVAGRGTRGHLLRSHYVETYWLPILGPSSIALLRMLAAGLALSPAGFTLDVPEAARALGIGHRGGRNGPMARTIQRCCAFGAARLDHGHQLRVRPRLATLSPRQLGRLPAALQQGHADALSVARRDLDVDAGGASTQRERCRMLALSLVELGESSEEAEQQLHRWQFHPALAHESVAWATARLAERRAVSGAS
jgi:hypothetical protein